MIELVDKKANPLRAAAGKLKAKIEPLSSYYLLPSAFCLFIYLLCLPIYCLLRVFGLIELMQVMTFVIPIALCAFSVAHAAETHGAKVAALLFGSGALISLGTEMLGTATGLLFGNYTYTEHMGYKLFGLVPWLIPVAWCSMLYPVWCCIRFLFPFSHSPLLLVSLSALAVTAWDLSLDPRMVQDGNWIWRDGGFYFGVPLSNYVGWVVTAGLVYAVWWLVEIGDWRLIWTNLQSPISNLISPSGPTSSSGWARAWRMSCSGLAHGWGYAYLWEWGFLRCLRSGGLCGPCRRSSSPVHHLKLLNNSLLPLLRRANLETG